MLSSMTKVKKMRESWVLIESIVGTELRIQVRQ